MIGLLYRKILKPILFLFPADDVHVFFLKMGNFIGRYPFFRHISRFFFFYKNDSLSQNIFNLEFTNPIGLAAGFDYNADLIEVLPDISFGYQAIGTVTFWPYKGNAKPMLGRLPKSKSLLVNKGFKNHGIESILNKVSKTEKRIPLGISIGSTNKLYKNIDEMIEDIISSFKKVTAQNYFDYYELNISCPNLINVESLKDKFDEPIGFGILLNKLSYLNINKPLFVKMYLEKSVRDTILLTEVASIYPFVKGFIFSNLVKNRNNPLFDKNEIANAGKGNFSGKPTEQITNDLISEVYKKYKNRFLIIGCGGVFTGRDAYEKIKRGATLVQLITGMIYEGPSVIGKINKDLAKLLKKDGYKNIKEAVGVYYK